MNDSVNKGKTVGGILGATAGVIGTIMANPIGKWAVFTAQDETALAVHHMFEDLSKSRAVGDTAYRIYSFITNTIMAYPVILPIAGGIVASGIGAIIGKKVTKAKLKHQSLKQKEKKYTK